MKIRTAKRHVREGFKNLYRNGWMTFASLSAVTITLLLVGMFLSLILNINRMASSVENDVQINVQIDLTAGEEQQDVLKQEIADISKVKSIVFSSRDEELKKLKASFGEDGRAFELFQQENPLSDVFIVKTIEPQDVVKVAEKIDKLDNVSNVQYGAEDVKRLFQIVNTIRNVGFVLVIGLLFTAMFLISNTIKIAIFARKTEIGIMRLVGATNGFIRLPFLLEGLLLGVLGSIIPITLVLITYHSIYGMMKANLRGTLFEVLPLNPYGIYIALTLLVLGACIGMWGSVMSIRKFLKK